MPRETEGKPLVLHLPLPEDLSFLHAGDQVLLYGPVLTARDAAHRRMVETWAQGKEIPFSLKGETIYYVGPCPAPPGWVVGAAGPTTSGRMDQYTPALLARGLRGMIGKGARSEEVVRAIVAHGAVYFAALGGAGALLARCVKRVEEVAYPDLGTEAVRRFWLDGFPAVVAVDPQGHDLYREGPKMYARTGGKAPTGGLRWPRPALTRETKPKRVGEDEEWYGSTAGGPKISGPYACCVIT